ncbi:hypothetical protein TNCT_311971 [Trichonephila clavata]|uniref:Uncharacterized protein n=1 Tax=Trichonephila clavata TaxID=2740835 RepID=A0A8X6LGE0_TRICU|nr:hypothetical protein TNCT_311971 [Trichonephila clavata]
MQKAAFFNRKKKQDDETSKEYYLAKSFIAKSDKLPFQVQLSLRSLQSERTRVTFIAPFELSVLCCYGERWACDWLKGGPTPALLIGRFCIQSRLLFLNQLFLRLRSY